MIFSVLFKKKKKKSILLVGEAGCAQNTMCSYLKAAKRGKPDSVQKQRGSRVRM